MNKIYEGTLFVANATNLIIAPVGWAWYSAVMDDAANKPLLFDSDGAHPSLHGSYLMACVMNAVIFQNSDTAIGFYSSLPVEKAKYYQKKAVTTVFDSLELWNIIPNSSGITHDNPDHRAGFEISRIYPNPLNESTQIDFWIGKRNHVSLCICDFQGKMLKTIMNRILCKGDYTVRFDVDHIPGGLYYMQLKCGNQTKYKKILIQK